MLYNNYIVLLLLLLSNICIIPFVGFSLSFFRLSHLTQVVSSSSAALAHAQAAVVARKSCETETKQHKTQRTREKRREKKGKKKMIVNCLL